MENRYKRNFYYEVVQKIKEYNCTFILGPRKCGKTICMTQLRDDYNSPKSPKSSNINNKEREQITKATYIDFKNMTDDERLCSMDVVLSAISDDKNELFLLDEMTYLPLFDTEIGRIQSGLNDLRARGIKPSTRIVFAGSQSFALEHIESVYFSGTAGVVRPHFLQYNEWLDYKRIVDNEELEPSRDSYFRFLIEVDDFYGMGTISQYIKGCVDETIISNEKSANIIRGNYMNGKENRDGFTETLLDIMYACMMPLHNQSVNDNFNDRYRLKHIIQTEFRDQYKSVGGEAIEEKIDAYLKERYNHLSRLPYKDFLEGLVFLYKNDLVSLTYSMANFKRTGCVFQDIQGETMDLPDKATFLSNVLIDVNYPMFLFAMIKDIVGGIQIADVSHDYFGSALECHLRGLLPDNSCAEFNGKGGHQVDYINNDSMVAIEFTVSDQKEANNLHFDELPKDFTNILACGKGGYKRNNVLYVPFYELVMELEKNNTLSYISHMFESKYGTDKGSGGGGGVTPQPNEKESDSSKEEVCEPPNATLNVANEASSFNADSKCDTSSILNSSSEYDEIEM